MSALHLLEKLWVRYPCAIHGRAIAGDRGLRQTSIIMEAVEPKSGTWKAEGKTEKLSLLVLAICIATLVTILLIRSF